MKKIYHIVENKHYSSESCGNDEAWQFFKKFLLNQKIEYAQRSVSVHQEGFGTILMSESANFSEIPEKFIFGYIFRKKNDKVELFYYNKNKNNGTPFKIEYKNKFGVLKEQSGFDAFLLKTFGESFESIRIVQLTDNDFVQITLFTDHDNQEDACLPKSQHVGFSERLIFLDEQYSFFLAKKDKDNKITTVVMEYDNGQTIDNGYLDDQSLVLLLRRKVQDKEYTCEIPFYYDILNEEQYYARKVSKAQAIKVCPLLKILEYAMIARPSIHQAMSQCNSVPYSDQGLQQDSSSEAMFKYVEMYTQCATSSKAMTELLKKLFVWVEKNQIRFYSDEDSAPQRFIEQWQNKLREIRVINGDLKKYYQDCYNAIVTIVESNSNFKQAPVILIFLVKIQVMYQFLIDYSDKDIIEEEFFSSSGACLSIWREDLLNNPRILANALGTDIIVLEKLTSDQVSSSADIIALDGKNYQMTRYKTEAAEKQCVYLFRYSDEDYCLASEADVLKLKKQNAAIFTDPSAVTSNKRVFTSVGNNNSGTQLNQDPSAKKPALEIKSNGIFEALKNKKTKTAVQERITDVLTNTLGVDMSQKEVHMDKLLDDDYYSVTIEPKAEQQDSSQITELPKPIMKLYDDKVEIPHGWKAALQDNVAIAIPKTADEMATQTAKELIAMTKMALDTFVATKKKTTAEHFGKKQDDRISIRLTGNNHRMLRIMLALVSAKENAVPCISDSDSPEFNNDSLLRDKVNALLLESTAKTNSLNDASAPPKECYSKYLKVVLFRPSAEHKEEQVLGVSKQLAAAL